MITLSDAIADRVIRLNPYHTVKPIDPDPKDVDKLITEAAWLIQHPPKKAREGRQKKEVQP